MLLPLLPLLLSRALPVALRQARAALLPFWGFDTDVDVSYTGQLGSQQGEGGAVAWGARPEERTLRGVRYAFSDDTALQVYAGYRERRDHAAAARLGGANHEERAVLLEAVRRAEGVGGGSEAGGEDKVVVVGEASSCAMARSAEMDGFEMRRGLAWGFAARHIHAREAAKAAERLKEEHGVTDVRNVSIKLRFTRRCATPLMLPLYSVQYQWSTKYGGNGDLYDRQEMAFYRAAVGGAAGTVAAQRHLSPRRAGLAAATAVAGVGTLVHGAMLAIVPESALLNLFGLEVATASVLAGLGGGLAAQMRQPADHHDARAGNSGGAEGTGAADPAGSATTKVGRHKRWFKETREWRSSSMMGGSAAASDEAAMQLLRERESVEWDVFEADERQFSDAELKRTWAETLMQDHASRRAEVRQRQRKRRQDAAAAREDAARERQRQRRAEAEGRRWSAGAGLGGRGMRGSTGNVRDRHGYYRLLGVGVSATAAEIKAAFRKMALASHPDTAGGGEGEAAARAVSFHKLQAAYRVLSDARLRERYNAGRTID